MPDETSDQSDDAFEAMLPTMFQTYRCDPQRIDTAFSNLMVVSQLLNDCPEQPREPSVLVRGRDHQVKATPVRSLLRVGRAEDCEISFPGIREMSRYHFRIQRNADGTYSVTDTGSANGTFLLGSSSRLDCRELRDGDVLEAGGFAFVFVRPDPL